MQYRVPRFNELADALVGIPTQRQSHHQILESGRYGFMIVNDCLYVRQGIYCAYYNLLPPLFNHKFN